MKKFFTLACAAMMTALTTYATEHTWNFSNWTAETISETTTIDGMTVYAAPNPDDSTKPISVVIDGSEKTIDGTNYTQRLKFGGKSVWDGTAPAARVLAFDVDGAVDIKIALTSSSSSGTGRNLIVYSGDKATELGKKEAPTSSIETWTVRYTGTEATTILIGTDAGINIYFVEVTPGVVGGEEGEDPEEPTTPDDPVVVSDYTWNFSDWTAGDITETTTVDGLTVYATSGKKVTIGSSKKTIDGTAYTQCLKLGGTGDWSDNTPTSRVVACEVSGPSIIEVGYAHSSKDGDPRNLNISANSKDNLIGSLTATAGDFLSGKVEYKGEEPATIYIYSAGSGINLYFIKVSSLGTSAISSVAADNADNAIYNVMGVKVDSNYKGLVIKNGKKFIQR